MTTTVNNAFTIINSYCTAQTCDLENMVRRHFQSIVRKCQLQKCMIFSILCFKDVQRRFILASWQWRSDPQLTSILVRQSLASSGGSSVCFEQSDGFKLAAWLPIFDACGHLRKIDGLYRTRGQELQSRFACRVTCL